MRTEERPSSVSASSRLLTSDCLRYGVVKPSVWLCWSACNQRQFIDFGCDSPSNFTQFWFEFGNARESLQRCRLLRLQSSPYGVSACRQQRLRTADCAPICLAWRFASLTLRCKSCGQSGAVGYGMHAFAIHLWPLCSVVRSASASGKCTTKIPGMLELARR